MANLYKRYMRLLEKWPLDPTKSPDLGQYLRQQIKIYFPKGDKSEPVDREQCIKNLESLERIAANEYGKKYPLKFTKTASGLTKEIINEALKVEFQEALQQQEQGFTAKVKNTINIYFSKDNTLKDNTPKDNKSKDNKSNE